MTDPAYYNRPSITTQVIAHLWDMHGWQKGLLAVSVFLFGGGSVGKMAGYFSPNNAPQQQISLPAPSNTTPYNPPPPVPQTQDQPTLRDRISPWAMRIGASFLAGFVIGVGLRIFIRITATVLILGIGALALLSYFNVMNVDLSAAETKYQSSIHWAQDQASRLAKVAESHLPSSGGSVVGAFAGFRRRRAVL
jgi:uncharacterized membrane protein (Fun14 family)